MRSVPLEILLDYSNWHAERKRWYLPTELSKSTRKVRLWINKKEIPPGDFYLENGCIYLKDSLLIIEKDTRALAELSLNSRAKMSTFTQICLNQELV